MGSSESESPAKASMASTAAQDQPPTTSSTPAAPAYPDWSSFQAYSPIPPQVFFPSPVASSPQGHPYMWGPQHMIPPYGTPPHPYVMYPPGGLYSHPSLPPGSHPFSPYAMPSPNGHAEASAVAPSGMEVDGKSAEGKDKSPLKSSKGSLGNLNMITGKNINDQGKTTGTSTNGGFSQSGDSGSEDSSEGSDANSQNDSQPKTSGGRESFGDTPQNGNRVRSSQNGVPRTSSQLALNQTLPVMPMPAAGVPGTIAGPATNLNIGMDYWAGTAPSAISPIRAKAPGGTVGGTMVHASASEWIQDERELKRQRRKQSNRESARRSRLRKQAECEELAQRVEVLKEENASLIAELNQIRKEHDQLLSENTSLKKKLGETPREESSGLDMNGQHSVDDSHQKPVDSDVQAGR